VCERVGDAAAAAAFPRAAIIAVAERAAAI
jgi:hypothetical protein